MLISLTGSAKLLLVSSPAADILLFTPFSLSVRLSADLSISLLLPRPISTVVLIRMLAGNLARSIKLARNNAQPRKSVFATYAFAKRFLLNDKKTKPITNKSQREAYNYIKYVLHKINIYIKRGGSYLMVYVSIPNFESSSVQVN